MPQVTKTPRMRVNDARGLSHRKLEEVPQLLAHFSREGTGRHARNNYIFLQNESASRIYLVLEGSVSLIATTESGREIEVGVVGPGELLGVSAIFLPIYPVSALATTEVIAATCGRQKIQTLVANDPTLAMSVMSSLAARLNRLFERLPELCCRTSQERLARFLHSSRGEGGSRIPLPRGSRIQLARHLGMQQETLSRAMRHLEELGMIGATSGGIEVLDANRLKDVAEGFTRPSHS